MQYLLMIYDNEAARNGISPGDLAKLSADYASFTRGLVENGQFKGGERLHPSSSATTVRVREGKTLLTDGPFIETQEQLAGYFVVEASNLDEATAIAAQIPGARLGAIEVRPIAVMTQTDLQRFGRAS